MNYAIALFAYLTAVIGNPVPAEPTKLSSEVGQSMLKTQIDAVLKNSLSFINSSIKDMTKTDEELNLWKNVSTGVSAIFLIVLFLLVVHWHQKTNTKLSKLKLKIKGMGYMTQQSRLWLPYAASLAVRFCYIFVFIAPEEVIFICK